MSEPAGGHSGKGSCTRSSQANGFVVAGPQKCWSRPDHYRGDMYRLFIVISEGADREHVARAIYATSEDDARQAHRENYADETVLAVQE